MKNFLIYPYSVMKQKDINLSSKVLLSEIISLSRNQEHCFASNEFFSQRLGIGERTVVSSLKELKEKGYITTKRKKYIRYIKLNQNKLKKEGIDTNIINAKSARINAESSFKNAESAQYNNKYNTNYNIINNNKNSSYNLAELMVIK